MSLNKSVKDIMVDIFDFPHVPYWFTIRQAVDVLTRVSAGKEKAVVTDTLLIFDEKYNYMGMVRHSDIIMGLEPSLLKRTEWTGGGEGFARERHVSEDYLARIAAGMFREESKKEAEKQINDIMIVTQASVSPEESPAKAAYLLSHHNLSYLPVLEDKKKLVGMVGMQAVFGWISSVVLE